MKLVSSQVNVFKIYGRNNCMNSDFHSFCRKWHEFRILQAWWSAEALKWWCKLLTNLQFLHFKDSHGENNPLTNLNWPFWPLFIAPCTLLSVQDSLFIPFSLRSQQKKNAATCARTYIESKKLHFSMNSVKQINWTFNKIVSLNACLLFAGLRIPHSFIVRHCKKIAYTPDSFEFKPFRQF